MKPVVSHHPVLLTEAMDNLVRNPTGCYAEGTFGRGGHAAALLARLQPEGRLISMDRDPDAAAVAREWTDPRFVFRPGRFSMLPEILRCEQIAQGSLDGVLLDLGVCSTQLDQAHRGFSFMRPGPLDMRMDSTQPLSAARWIAESSVQTLTTTFQELGEERFAHRIARAIVSQRDKQPIVSTDALAALVTATIPARFHSALHPATRVFQAIRMVVNDELGELERLVRRIIPWLRPGGRLVILTFHGGEARVIRSIIKDAHQHGYMTRLVKQAPSSEECRQNPRARSAYLRITERTHRPVVV